MVRARLTPDCRCSLIILPGERRIVLASGGTLGVGSGDVKHAC